MPTQQNAPILIASNLHKAYKQPHLVTLLKGVNLEVYPGETVAIVGRSGEGKSTLLQILGTLESPCSGSLKIAGQEISSSNKTAVRNQSIGFIFQSFHLLEDYTVLENILMPARIARQSIGKGSDAERRAHALLEKVGLKDRAHFNTKLLSGGEKQRVALARALCNDPNMILADEPSGNLDKQTAHLIHTLLLNLAKEHNKALVIVTHDQELAALCNKQYTLSGGQLHLNEILTQS